MLETLESAMAGMKSALADLDAADAPADVGAHLDLAINRLQAELAERGTALEQPASE
jgi:hypothetical protein